ncbi:MAG: type II toxin-antitoxin system VapC family toxin [Candidatus Eremiobacterota bacterium]
MIIVDTDIMIDILRQYPNSLNWLATIDEEDIALPGFVVFELLMGCRNKQEQDIIEKKISNYRILWPSEEICDLALNIFYSYYLSHNISVFDALIGYIAVELNLPLYTFNEKHYSVISVLKTIRPYKKDVI